MNKSFSDAQAPKTAPPRIIASFVSGFNAVASHVYLILFPVALDLLLWFGPHLRLKSLLYPVVMDAVKAVNESGPAQSQAMLAALEEFKTTFLEQYNLLSLLSTFPLGIPSLIAGQMPVKSPLGAPALLELNNPLLLPAGWFALTIAGFMMGSLYIASIARACRTETSKAPLSAGVPFAAGVPLRAGVRAIAWQSLQMLLLILFLTVLLVILAVPTLVISSVLILISPALASIAIMFMGLVTVWILIPLLFSPHGIFVFRQNAFDSALNSARIVRFFLPGTGLFLLAAIILYQGLDVLWRTPDERSWMLLIGIVGHAFISTGLLASSFFYFLDGIQWVQSLRSAAPVPSA